MRNFKSASANALLYSSILASGLLLVNGVTVTKSYALACTATTVIDGANGTACLNGASAATLTYETSNTFPYAGGDFTLLLFNHDVTAAAGNGITFSGVTGGNGTITLSSDSDVVSGAGADGINALSSTGAALLGNITINVLDTSSVAGAVDGIDALSTLATFGGSITINTAAGTTVTGGVNGINANVTAFGNVTVNALGAVTGGTNGIDANTNIGSVSITTGTAAVTGTAGDGIQVSAAGDVAVSTGGNVSGGIDGIDATSTFAGDVTVTTAAGTTVTGTAGDGIIAMGGIAGAGFVDATVNANGNVSGGVNGITATGGGSTFIGGDATVTVTDNSGTGGQTISGGTGDGIMATGGDGETGGAASVTITDNSSSGTTVTGGVNGITATAGSGTFGPAGDATVTIADNSLFGTTVTGGTGDGITATGGTFDGDATVGITDNSSSGTTVTGGVNGITATGGFDNTLGGDATVTITDNSTFGGTVITGTTGDGISATGGSGGSTGGAATVGITDNSSSGTTVTGGVNGITATGGSGTFDIGGAATVAINSSTFGGTVITGTTGDGITATGGSGGPFGTGGAATVTITDGSTSGTTVTGGVNGIMATGGDGGTGGGGDATVTINGSTFGGTVITGTTGAGILAAGGSGATSGGNVTVSNFNATVQGLTTGIDASSTTGSIITINNGTFGLIQNLSGDDADLAIRTAGGNTTINNTSATITGRIELSDGTNVMNNGGTWNTDGTSDFGTGAGSDSLNNTSSGVINAGNDAGVANVTSFLGLENLNNSGNVSLSDQAAGDGSNISDTLSTSGDYTGIGGTLGVDAFLGGPGSVSDVFAVGGDMFGTTSIVVNNTSPGGGAANDGILVVDVTGTASAGDFALAGGPIDTGFFVYDLEFNDTDQANDQFLLVSSPDSEIFETTAAVAGAQEIWRETAAAWETRQQAVRDMAIAGGCHVAAVADPPLEGGCAAENGLWLAGLGSWSKRDDEAEGFDLSYEQDIYGIVGGADFGASLGHGGTMMFGVLAGYVDSDLDFDDSATSIEHEGATVGAYAGWMGAGFFLNVLGKVDLLNMDYSAPSVPDGKDSADVTSYGGRADLGYRFGGDSLFVEPMVSVDAISTEIDEFSIGGSEIDAGTNESFRGGAGLRAGFDGEMIRVSALGRVWEVFDNDNEVDAAGIGVSDDRLEGTYGEAAAQVDVDLSTRAMLFLRGSVLFGDDYTKPAVHGGFNWSW